MARLSENASPVAREIFRRMQDKGLGQKALAVSAGVNETYVRDLFAGKSLNPRHEHLSRIATALGCSVIALIDPRVSESEPRNGEFVDDPQELAWLSFWRMLTPTGKFEALERLFSAATKPRG